MEPEEDQIEDGLEEVDEIVEPEKADKTADKDGDKPADKTADKPAVDPEIKRLQKENKALQGRVREADSAAGFWKGKADTAPAKPADKPAADNLDELDLVDIITTKGAKGLAEVMTRLGYAKRSDIELQISSTRNQISAEAAVLAKYPDLADSNSPLFEKTAEIFNQLRQDPHMAESDNLMLIAARTAAAELGLSNDNTRGQRRAAPKADEDEDERSERIARQSGDRGRRPAGQDRAEELSPLQKRMVQKFRDAGAEITEEGYKKRAMGGVRMGGVPTHRARREAA